MMSKEWEAFKLKIYPEGINHAEKERQLKLAFYGGGLAMISELVKVSRSDGGREEMDKLIDEFSEECTSLIAGYMIESHLRRMTPFDR